MTRRVRLHTGGTRIWIVSRSAPKDRTGCTSGMSRSRQNRCRWRNVKFGRCHFQLCEIHNCGNIGLLGHRVNRRLADVELEMAPNLGDPEAARLEFAADREPEQPCRTNDENVGRARDMFQSMTSIWRDLSQNSKVQEYSFFRPVFKSPGESDPYLR
jgi:hypothetical protein